MRNAHDFFDGCFALGDTPPAVLPQSFHALGDGTLLELAAVALLHDQLSQGFSYEANLIDCRAPLIAGLPALIATGAAAEAAAEFFYRKTNLGQIFTRVIDQLHAIWTNCAHEPLRDKRFHHRRKQERLHVHIKQAGYAADGVIRVERAENKVTGHRCADRNVGGFNVANLAHHDYVGVLSQNVAETFRKSQVDFRFHVDLRNARQSIFHRLFDRNDATLHGIDAAEKAIKRGRFSAASWAGKKNDPVRLREQISNNGLLFLAQIQTVESKLLLAAAEQSQADRFSVDGGNGRHAHVNILITRLQIHAPILGQTAFRDVHVRHHLQP